MPRRKSCSNKRPKTRETRYSKSLRLIHDPGGNAALETRAVIPRAARVSSCYWKGARAQKRTHRDFSCLVPVAIHALPAHEDGETGTSSRSGETSARSICARSHSVANAWGAVSTSWRARSITSPRTTAIGINSSWAPSSPCARLVTAPSRPAPIANRRGV